MHLRDASQAFADIYGNPNNAEGFMLRPRIDSDPATGQRHDVTHLSENGRKKAHPLMMTLANVSQTKRWATSGHCLLGTFPIPPRSMPSALYAWACDYPESGKISGTLSGGTERPCSICYAQKSPNVTRTVSDQRWIVANHRALSPNPEKTVGSFFSTFPSETTYFATGANLAAFEHRAVLQVLVFIVADKLTPDEMEALRLYLEWYLLCCRVPGHTEGSLLQLEGLTLR
ncbi:hypothetical protein CLOP_g21660 [Closterium sp. NIES-67]|nr:hypothetical protein CLOP_g21660 [Closterium sp. NIES-67]